ncbi:SDR family oxidoreductase [Lysinimonas soli]|uniref:SDR family oxidoreductase n=1 Tax=Lysinimonas soli TaxID=1074233 RepID=A0ABW0NPK2_9MICO
MTVLVTGGTGGLGRPTTTLLRSAGHEVRVLSRRPGEGRATGDLSTGSGLADALTGVDTVLHLATTGRSDAAQTTHLLDAAKPAGVAHLIYISIVGVDEVPLGYYRDKLACERLIEASGIPFTILRATQFHDFVAAVFRPQRHLPVLISLDVLDQPIAVDEVAERLTELAASRPAGRVADIGGPETRPVREFAEIWQRAHGTHRPIWNLPVPGGMGRAMRRGDHTTALPGFGRQTFAQYAAADAARLDVADARRGSPGGTDEP